MFQPIIDMPGCQVWVSWLVHNNVPDITSKDFQVLKFDVPLFLNCKFQPINYEATNFGSGNSEINNLIAVIMHTNRTYSEVFHDTTIAIPAIMKYVASELWCHLVIFWLEFGTWPKSPLQRNISPRKHGGVSFSIAICPNLGSFKEHIKIWLSI